MLKADLAEQFPGFESAHPVGADLHESGLAGAARTRAETWRGPRRSAISSMSAMVFGSGPRLGRAGPYSPRI